MSVFGASLVLCCEGMNHNLGMHEFVFVSVCVSVREVLEMKGIPVKECQIFEWGICVLQINLDNTSECATDNIRHLRVMFSL